MSIRVHSLSRFLLPPRCGPNSGTRHIQMSKNTLQPQKDTQKHEKTHYFLLGGRGYRHAFRQVARSLLRPRTSKLGSAFTLVHTGSHWFTLVHALAPGGRGVHPFTLSTLAPRHDPQATAFPKSASPEGYDPESRESPTASLSSSSGKRGSLAGWKERC